MNAADVLDAAADVIARDGWCQHWQHSPDGRHCADGAIEIAADPVNGWSPQASIASRAVQDHLGYPGSLFFWNDAPGRTADEVINTLRACAQSLRAAS